MSPSKKADSASIMRRTIFLVILFSLATCHLFFTFRGLSNGLGMDQAQIGREIARGNGFTTKVIRPLAVSQLQGTEKEVNFTSFPDTYHSPLNPLIYGVVFKAIGADDSIRHDLAANATRYQLDRVVSAICVIFFLIAIGINYLLISRIFDEKIASVVAILMLVSELMWSFSQSGLPQMLMLALFSTATYITWLAVERQEHGRNPLMLVTLSGVFFGLLALAHWLTLWIFFGYVVFAAFYFKPRGGAAAILMGVIALFVTAPLIYYAGHSGGLMGTAFHAVHNGMSGSEEAAMRSMEIQEPNMKGVVINVLRNTLLQASQIHSYLGGMILAPAFFLALLHPFKSNGISLFRWNILGMWLMATMGMSLFGLHPEKAFDPNQLHILFMPLMAAYGIAMLCILWARLPFSQTGGAGTRNLHLVVLVVISATPIITHLPLNIKETQKFNRYASVYHPPSLNRELKSWTKEGDILVSDQPWAVAWYADRHAIWLPKKLEEFTELEALAAQQRSPIAGVHISRYSYGRTPALSVFREYGNDFTPLVFNYWPKLLGSNSSTGFVQQNPQLKDFADTYGYPKGLVSSASFTEIYYSRTPIVDTRIR